MKNGYTFEDFCEEFLDLHIGLMSEEQLISSKAAYAAFLRDSKTPAEVEKHQRALAKARESRKLAKFYGGKALTGSPAQKKWAEEIREKVLESDSLTDEQKSELVTLGGFTSTSSFWINNRDKAPSNFEPKKIVAENNKLKELYHKHYDTLVRSGSASDKERARKEIYGVLSANTIAIRFEFPNCDFYDNFGALMRGLKFRC